MLNRLVLLASVLTLACGCVSVRPPKTAVKPIPDLRPAIPEGHALVVFSRPHYAWGETFFIYDDKGGFVGEIWADQRIHHVVPAGVHTFVGWGHMVMGDYRSASLVTGELKPGRAYHVQIGLWDLPQQMTSVPLGFSDNNCVQLSRILANTDRVGPDPAYDPSIHAPGKVEKQIASAKERFEKAKKRKEDLVWRFHETGGTYEAFFVSEALTPEVSDARAKIRAEARDGSGDRKKAARLLLEEEEWLYYFHCLDLAEPRYGEIDKKAWDEELKSAGLKWVPPKKKDKKDKPK